LYDPINHPSAGNLLSELNIIPPLPGPRQREPRDRRLDFWRGLCLIDMVLVHLVYAPANVQMGDFLGLRLIGAYTRFAAGGFIFISGLSIGVIFLPRAREAKYRPGVYRALWRRSIYILAVQYVSAIGLLLLAAARDPTSGPLNPWAMIRDVVLLRKGGDLLPFYVFMIALSPFLLEIVRRPRGWITVIIASLCIFTWGVSHPWFLSPSTDQKFPPVLWQGLFVMGLIFGVAFPYYNALARRWKILAAAVAWTIFALLFDSEYSSDFGLPHLNLGMSFSKVPLSSGEALRYLSMIFGIATTTDLLWRFISPTGFAHFVETLGRKSLPVYVAHLWVVEGMAILAAATVSMGRWQIIYAPAAVLILWLFALLLDVYKTPRSARQPMSWTIPGMARS
jgi:hypothetical protein